MPAQALGRQQLLHGQPAPLATRFEFVQDGSDHFLWLYYTPKTERAKKQMR
ncbi:hypothetical protein [Hymenobacter seoulensis]